MARVFDTTLDNGNAHERSLNSSKFLELLNDAILSKNSDIDRRFTLADSYIYTSYRRIFSIAAEVRSYIFEDLAIELNRVRNLATGPSPIPHSPSKTILTRAQETSEALEMLCGALSVKINDTFTGQAEEALPLMQELISCSQAMQDQINVYAAKLLSDQKDAEQQRVDLLAIKWSIISAIAGIIATLVAVLTFDSDKFRAIWTFIVGSI